MLYTSGTTGRPKGVPRSHPADRAGGLTQALQHGYGRDERTLGVMPLYHTMGIHSLLAMHLVGGCFVPQARLDPSAALELVARAARQRAVPRADALLRPARAARPRARRQVARCARSVRGRGDDVEPRRALLPGARPGDLRQPLRVDRDLHVHDRQRAARKPGCAGRPAVNTRLRFGRGGEICIHLSSDEAFAGYWNRPDADEKAIRDGWYHTGDTGHLDEDGDLWIDGRVDDMIISGGENIHPLEVEDVLARHPGVRGGRGRRRGRRAPGAARGRRARRRGDGRGARRPLPRIAARALQATTRVPVRG